MWEHFTFHGCYIQGVSIKYDHPSSVSLLFLHRVSKNDTDVAHYNFNAYERILVIFGRNIDETVQE